MMYRRGTVRDAAGSGMKFYRNSIIVNGSCVALPEWMEGQVGDEKNGNMRMVSATMRGRKSVTMASRRRG